ncbi:hypothetical protein IV203_004591 [Nitzschia inconspicua]|uniref:Uncharacterized protein n=1 Tax=Nitzschia inconspicua TaxID=303405 RepID=A0A9K3L432_9STRA|nr:hypothetical protein IV203_004591 [Nitzschia inconspicua]
MIIEESNVGNDILTKMMMVETRKKKKETGQWRVEQNTPLVERNPPIDRNIDHLEGEQEAPAEPSSTPSNETSSENRSPERRSSSSLRVSSRAARRRASAAQLYLYNSSRWTQYLQPDTAMKQLLVFWCVASLLLLLGISAILVYAKARVDLHVITSRVSEYHGRMQVQNVSIVSEERVEPFQWSYYRIFEAQPRLQVSWECPNTANTASPLVPTSTTNSSSLPKRCESANVVLYDACLEYHFCHKYLRALQEEEDEEILDDGNQTTNGTTVSNLCRNKEVQEVMDRVEKCVQDAIRSNSDDEERRRRRRRQQQRSIVLYGDCNSCTAYATIPAPPKNNQRLLFSGTFFIIMGLVSFYGWYHASQLYKTEFMPAPPEGSDNNNNVAATTAATTENTVLPSPSPQSQENGPYVGRSQSPHFRLRLPRGQRRQASANDPMESYSNPTQSSILWRSKETLLIVYWGGERFLPLWIVSYAEYDTRTVLSYFRTFNIHHHPLSLSDHC